ncbi:hypothetical protein MRB53_006030 [Persea americana]|uniref:Uncharacterized protein n=1 Tax=Persea americana TaxID=3435 RepID=A0ACC2MGK1_PERAE|nr:hypothetical protein MRB53_006030 [Persea americana]
MSIDPLNILIGALQELCNRVARAVMELETERKDVLIEKKSLQQFSRYVSEISMLLQALKNKRIEQSIESTTTRNALQHLNSQLKTACEIIEKHKSGSRVRLLMNFSLLLEQMEQSAKEISETVMMLGVANHDTIHTIKSKTDQIADNLRSLEFRSAAATEAIVLEIEKSMVQNGRNREHNRQLLQKVAQAVGAAGNTSVVHEELELLQREKAEMEAKMQKSEALQLSQLIRLLSSSTGSEMVSNQVEEMTDAALRNEVRQVSQEERTVVIVNANNRQEDLISPFKCPLSSKVMEDPVSISCGHSFERGAILEHFGRGARTCPECQEELSSLDLTPNFSLRSIIQEWRKRNMDMKLSSALSNITSDDPNKVSQALEDLMLLMEIPCYRDVVTEQGLVPKIVKSLRALSTANTKAALKCLCYLANHSEDNKKAIVEAGAIRYIQKQFRREEAQPDAIAVLVELSENEEFAKEIGNTKDCIPYLVSLLQNRNPDVSQKAERVVENLSFNTHFVIKMAEAGYFQPFLARFNQGPLETQALMATQLVQMQLSEERVKVFENKQFVSALVRVLSSSSPAYRSACLQCIKKLSAYPTMAKWFLAETATIPALLSHISFVSSDPHWRKTATEILTSLIEPIQLSDFESNPNLQEVQSLYNIGVFLDFVTAETSDSQTKVQFLLLLLAIGNKSKVAQELIRSNEAAITRLFSSLEGSQQEVIQHTLKLIYCIAEDHPAGTPLPPSPAKESSINALVTILTSSPAVQDRSVAAGIISKLPADDPTVDHILCRSEALKAIRGVICTADSSSLDFAGSQAGSLLENALAALIRYTEPSKPELRRQLSELELYPSLIRVLSNGSSRAKQWAATALARLSQPTVLPATEMADTPPSLWLSRLLPIPFWCCGSPAAAIHWSNSCPVHGLACSSRDTFCLVKADAVRPLVQALTETDAAEAALLALETLLNDQSTLSRAASTIVENQGVSAILDVLERGSLPAKSKALDLFQKISQHVDIRRQFRRSESVLIQLLQDDVLKKKAALVLSEMDVISKQSSFF